MWLFEVVKEVTLTSVKCYNHLRDDIFVHRDKLEIKSKFCIGLLDSFLLLLFFFWQRKVWVFTSCVCYAIIVCGDTLSAL